MPPTAAEIERRDWDLVVVGTGMGGGTLGHALAQVGWSVLFLEQGRSHLDPANHPILGSIPEKVILGPALRDPAAIRAAIERGGRWTERIDDFSLDKPKSFVPFIGAGVGGSSALYGMVCERFFSRDFTPRANHENVDGTSLPDAWPIDYKRFRPWYEAAERLYDVHGSLDPLRPEDADAPLSDSPPFTPANARLAEFLTDHSLHPYHLHVACGHHPECQTCQGYLCHRDCKRDAASQCVAPAIAQHEAVLVDQCAVTGLEADARRVRRVHARWRGEPVSIKARFVAMAAGALATPVLLLHSRGAGWPRGLANGSGQVGRNLMRHCIDLMIANLGLREAPTGQIKELAFNDLYFVDGQKLGTVQSFGNLPPLDYFTQRTGMAARMMRFFRPAIQSIWNRFVAPCVTLAAIMEDLPVSENRVEPGDSISVNGSPRIKLWYRMHPTDRVRMEAFRQRLNDLFRPFKPSTLRGAEDNSGIAHVCGTCRFGADPRTSVVDPDCRAHELDNLYVVDGSFFPSSGGLNPSLTIAANALRVADGLKHRRG